MLPDQYYTILHHAYSILLITKHINVSQYYSILHSSILLNTNQYYSILHSSILLNTTQYYTVQYYSILLNMTLELCSILPNTGSILHNTLVQYY